MANNLNITAEYVRSILDYNPETGIFTWKTRADCDQAWNARWAGKPAGAVHNIIKSYQISINKKIHRAHRIAYLYMIGIFPKYEIDHINGNPSDNRWSNLRMANRSQQNQNRSGVVKRNGIKGVRLHKPTGKWQARLKDKHLGLFNCPAVASFAYQVEADKEYLQFARPF